MTHGTLQTLSEKLSFSNLLGDACMPQQPRSAGSCLEMEGKFGGVGLRLCSPPCPARPPSSIQDCVCVCVMSRYTYACMYLFVCVYNCMNYTCVINCNCMRCTYTYTYIHVSGTVTASRWRKNIANFPWESF